MIRKIQLYGTMADRYTDQPFEKDADSLLDLISALKSELPDFRSYISENPDQIIILTDEDKKNPRSLDNEMAMGGFGDTKEIHIIPNHNGAGLFIATAVFGMAAGAVSTMIVGFIINTLISMAISAIMQSLSPTEKTQARENDVQQQPSFLYNGAQNVTEQGFPVPVIYGIHMTGSIVASAGTSVEQMLSTPAQSAPPPNGGGTTQPTSPPAVSWQWGGGA